MTLFDNLITNDPIPQNFLPKILMSRNSQIPFNPKMVESSSSWAIIHYSHFKLVKFFPEPILSNHRIINHKTIHLEFHLFNN